MSDDQPETWTFSVGGDADEADTAEDAPVEEPTPDEGADDGGAETVADLIDVAARAAAAAEDADSLWGDDGWRPEEEADDAPSTVWDLEGDGDTWGGEEPTGSDDPWEALHTRTGANRPARDRGSLDARDTAARRGDARGEDDEPDTFVFDVAAAVPAPAPGPAPARDDEEPEPFRFAADLVPGEAPMPTPGSGHDVDEPEPFRVAAVPTDATDEDPRVGDAASAAEDAPAPAPAADEPAEPATADGSSVLDDLWSDPRPPTASREPEPAPAPTAGAAPSSALDELWGGPIEDDDPPTPSEPAPTPAAATPPAAAPPAGAPEPAPGGGTDSSGEDIDDEVWSFSLGDDVEDDVDDADERPLADREPLPDTGWADQEAETEPAWEVPPLPPKRWDDDEDPEPFAAPTDGDRAPLDRHADLAPASEPIAEPAPGPTADPLDSVLDDLLEDTAGAPPTPSPAAAPTATSTPVAGPTGGVEDDDLDALLDDLPGDDAWADLTGQDTAGTGATTSAWAEAAAAAPPADEPDGGLADAPDDGATDDGDDEIEPEPGGMSFSRTTRGKGRGRKRR